MVNFSNIAIVLLDIEGTVSDVRFVYECHVPVREQYMKSFLSHTLILPDVRAAIEQSREIANLEIDHWFIDSKQKEIDVVKLDSHLQEHNGMRTVIHLSQGTQGLV